MFPFNIRIMEYNYDLLKLVKKILNDYITMILTLVFLYFLVIKHLNLINKY